MKKNNIVLIAEDLHKEYDPPNGPKVLRGISLEIESGQSCAILGRSGEGKTTLLHILGTLEKPSRGTLLLCGKNADLIQQNEFRNEHIGFIFQAYNLFEDLTLIENILMPKKIARKNTDLNSPSYQMAMDLLLDVALTSKSSTLAKFLSGGEKQRAAIARALCNDPEILIADEPTGNLDLENARLVQKLLLDFVKKRKKTLILATHDVEFAKLCDRIFLLQGGILIPYPMV
ncbi:MAG: ABC transporter ATP-binding protein [Chlamydiae bacterium]|nr:ABC transporter ATP-binding protein [Chlamydiota bacterium]